MGLGDDLERYGMNKWTVFPCCFFFLGTIIGISLQAANWRTVQPLYWGVVYNMGSVRLNDNKLYGPGRYCVGPGSDFFTWPSTDETILFNDASANATQVFPLGNSFVQPEITARSKDGLRITMDVMVNYQLGVSDATRASDLVIIYNAFKDNYKRPIAFMAESAILEVISTYNVNQIFTKRAEIVSEISKKITTYQIKIKMTFKVLSIINMDQPAAYSAEILNTQIALQGVEEKTNLKEGIKVSLTTNELLATTDKTILEAKRTSEGTIYKKMQEEKGKGLKSRYDSLVTAYNKVKTEGQTVNDTKAWKFIFIHWMMAYKLGTPPSRTVLMKNMKGLVGATASTA